MVILDEKPARRLALGLGLTMGILLAAKQSDLIQAVRPLGPSAAICQARTPCAARPSWPFTPLSSPSRSGLLTCPTWDRGSSRMTSVGSPRAAFAHGLMCVID